MQFFNTKRIDIANNKIIEFNKKNAQNFSARRDLLDN